MNTKKFISTNALKNRVTLYNPMHETAPQHIYKGSNKDN